MSDTTDAGRIERDLNQTRSRLGSHLNELRSRLSPGQVLDDLMIYFRGSEGAEFGRNLLDNVRANPLPAAITTVGLAWLMASSPRRMPDSGTARETTSRASGGLPIFGHNDYATTAARLSSARQGVTRATDESEYAFWARLDQAHGQALGLAQHPDETTESFGQRIHRAVAAVEQAMKNKGHDLHEQAGDAIGAAGSAISSFGTSAQEAAQLLHPMPVERFLQAEKRQAR